MLATVDIFKLQGVICQNSPILGRQFVKRFTYAIRPLSILSVSNIGVLWPNGWMDQDETWHGGRPQPRQHCVTWGPSSPSPKGAQPPLANVLVAKRLDELRCHLVWRYASDQKKGHSPTQFLADVFCSQTAGCYATSLQTYYQDQLCRPCFSLLLSCCLEFTNC